MAIGVILLAIISIGLVCLLLMNLKVVISGFRDADTLVEKCLESAGLRHGLPALPTHPVHRALPALP